MVDTDALKRLTARVILAVVVWSFFAVAPAFAGIKLAVVVAVSEFEDEFAPTLPYVEVDSKTTIKTLTNLGFEVYAFCEESSYETSEKIMRVEEPTRENVLKFLKEELPTFVGKNDVVFLYFSTHGRALEGRTYLVAKDTKFLENASGVPDVAPETALSARELREVASKLRTERVFLTFDACESGGVRAPGYKSVLECLQSEDGSTVATLASCATNQNSGAVTRKDGKAISHFTYWLNQGLLLADENSDGEIATDELAKYVKYHATYASDLLVARDPTIVEQTPVVVAPEGCAPFALAEVDPNERLDAVDDVAEQVAICLYATAKKNRTRELNLFVGVGVQPSRFDSEPERDAATAFRRAFAEKFKSVLKRKLKDVAVELEFASKPSPDGCFPEFRCEIEPDERAYKFTAKLTGLKYADGTDAPEYEIVAKIAFDLETRARLGEGVDDDYSDAASVWLEVVKTNGKIEKRFPEEIDGSLWIPLDVGEKYRVFYKLERAPKNGVGVRALVDGYNTLPQYESYVYPKYSVLPPPLDEPKKGSVGDELETQWKDEFVERSEQVENILPRVALDEARFWYAKGKGTYSISGFYRNAKDGETKGANAAYAQFEVASNDGASERNDAVGSILIAFYHLAPQRTPGPNDARTVPSEERPTTLIRVKGLEIAETQEPFESFSIRYASSEELERFRNDPDAFYEEQNFVYY